MPNLLRLLPIGVAAFLLLNGCEQPQKPPSVHPAEAATAPVAPEPSKAIPAAAAPGPSRAEGAAPDSAAAAPLAKPGEKLVRIMPFGPIPEGRHAVINLWSTLTPRMKQGCGAKPGTLAVPLETTTLNDKTYVLVRTEKCTGWVNNVHIRPVE